MKRNVLCATGAMFCILAVVSALAMAKKTEVLKITFGKATNLTHASHQDTAEVIVSRTGMVSVLYPKAPRESKGYRVSNDGGNTWSEEIDAPANWAAAMSVGLSSGSVLKCRPDRIPIGDVVRHYNESRMAIRLFSCGNPLFAKTDSSSVQT